MDLAINIVSSCCVRVLLVPVPPIKNSTFWKHVELVKQFSVVRLGDVTPDLQKDTSAMFGSQAFQEGQMHFQFTTIYTRDNTHLEDFQPHRRIFGVIGIMDCQEWKDKDLSEGHRLFVETLNKYPTAIATRCFAFDPIETQPDNTKGLIMIPNVGNMSFYMSTMICDFASEILSQFGNLAHRIESLELLESPLPRAGYFMGHEPTPSGGIMPQPSMSTPGPRPGNTDSRPLYGNRVSQPPKPTQSSSSSILKRVSTPTAPTRQTTSSSTMNRKFSTQNQQPPLSPPLPSPQSAMNRPTSTPSIPPLGELGKTKRRTPGRIKKLLADLYLLAGRLPDAINFYNQAIEMTKLNSDYLWLGSALEGLTCSKLLLEYLQTDSGHIVARTPPSIADMVADTPMSPTAEQLPPSVLEGPKSTVSEVIERYTSVLQYYSKVNTTTNNMMPGLVYAEACLKMARFLLTLYQNNGWSDDVLSLLIQGKISKEEQPSHTSHNGLIAINDLIKHKESGVTRHDIAGWITRVWDIQMDDLTLLDQINLMTHMSSVLDVIGYHRKSAWIMYESVNRMLPLLIQGRATLASTRNQTKKDPGKGDSGILEVLKRICEVYGLGERNVHDGGALVAMKGTQANEKDDRNTSGVRDNEANDMLRFGWPKLQIDILRQCIAVSEALPDYGAVLYYTTVMLKNLYKYISKDEQIRLASSIQRIVAMGKRVGHLESNINYWGVNIVTAVEAVRPIPRKVVYKRPIKNSVTATTKKDATGDPFIYNPFTQKRNEKSEIILVKDELFEFKVTLSNPFGFDLELQHIALSTSGISFNTIPTSAVIPANSTILLRLTGIPEETGTLVIRGCVIKIVGFTEQEFLVDSSHESLSTKNEKETSDISKDRVTKLKQSGLQAIQYTHKRETSDELPTLKFYELGVIEEQPLLKIKSTSLLHDAIMLYEGEMAHINIQLENIGNVPVDFVMLSFVDSTTLHPALVNPELPVEEQYEIELFTKGTHVFSWEGFMNEAAQIVGKKVFLPPGEHWEIVVNVYGKRGCSGGTIQVDYGYLDRAIQNNSNSETGGAMSFYTRQLYLPVLITVYQNLEPINWDILYLRHNTLSVTEFVEAATHRIRALGFIKSSAYEQPVEDLLLIARQSKESQQDGNDYCLVTLDVRNALMTPFDLELVINNDDLDDRHPGNLKSLATIQPGATKRLTLPVKRIFLQPSECTKPVPSLEPNKQFVVSQGPKLSADEERMRLQMFWYREKLLQRIKATWRCSSTGRHGVLDLRPSLRLTQIQLNVLKKEDIEFMVEMDGNNVIKANSRRFQCHCGDLVTMKISIRNRHVHPVKLILRIQPVQSYNDGAKEYDLSGKLLMQGLQQVVLPEIPPNDGVVSHQIPLYFLSRGQFEILYNAEDVHSREIYYDHEWVIVDVVEPVLNTSS